MTYQVSTCPQDFGISRTTSATKGAPSNRRPSSQLTIHHLRCGSAHILDSRFSILDHSRFSIFDFRFSILDHSRFSILDSRFGPKLAFHLSKTSTVMKKLILIPVLMVMMASCTFYEIEPQYDHREKF